MLRRRNWRSLDQVPSTWPRSWASLQLRQSSETEQSSWPTRVWCWEAVLPPRWGCRTEGHLGHGCQRWREIRGSTGWGTVRARVTPSGSSASAGETVLWQGLGLQVQTLGSQAFSMAPFYQCSSLSVSSASFQLSILFSSAHTFQNMVSGLLMVSPSVLLAITRVSFPICEMCHKYRRAYTI